MKVQPSIYARDEIYRMLLTALVKKKPVPPDEWSVVKLDEEVRCAGREYEPSLYLRHTDALAACLFYLVDFARRMPDWINLSNTNERVRAMCGELADEIEQITYSPENVIAERGKLKAWLAAKLAVHTCLICREETARVVAEEAAVRSNRVKQPAEISSPRINCQSLNWRSDLARRIFQKVSAAKEVSIIKKAGTGKSTENSSAEQPSLF